jgi:hypothetical protein
LQALRRCDLLAQFSQSSSRCPPQEDQLRRWSLTERRFAMKRDEPKPPTGALFKPRSAD